MSRTHSAPFLLLATLVALPICLLAEQAQPLKVFISVDMEGLAGVVSGSDVSSGSPDYPHFRAIMAAETNAAIDGAFRGGATDVLVRDSHGSKQNLLPGDLVPVTSTFGLPMLGEINFALLDNPRAAREPVEALIGAIVGRVPV